MYLPDEIPDAKVLITVKTYPLPSSKYEELVCTAGFLNNGKWIRIYPIPFRTLSYESQYSKYHWITLDLVRNTSDFRPESYRPKHGIENIRIGPKIETGKNRDWAERKQYALNEIFYSMDDIIQLAKGNERKSLATLKPREIVDFVIEPDERDWKPEWRDQLLQYNLFDLDEQGQGKLRQVIPKLPYKYFYKLLSKGDKKPRKMMVEDWELGALYWNCYRRHGKDEAKANELVKKKYLDEFCTKDLHLFVGTTKQFHLISQNPFVIVGVFPPPKLQTRDIKQAGSSSFTAEGVQQKPLFEFD
ncbi:hypothetical protein EPA93_26150 [Ktedonosporobacter rubrisoli]|uniref:Uncharacterized protein n=1 Tax=Ktedonosporobacter rubrisoli TaxID=2509675 RepID=A0A4P6JUG6_KTERU|nr:hypothetical protein [Ktedonosporobacter rubrisoli]QBD79279.1 hypothetical protein EPA93_26150 [Ktedonosporobacter rubrisoli]